MDVAVPVIDTGRLPLRGHRMDDFAACAAMWGDPGVTRYISGKPFTPEEVWARMLRYVGHWSWMGYGYWAIEERATGRFAGELGFANFRREIYPPFDGTPEIGWVLPTHVHGKGYATEAVGAVVAWGEAHFGARETVCLIHPENERSIREAARAGYRETQRTTYKGQPAIVMRRRGCQIGGGTAH